MNNVILTGRITKDPELVKTQSGYSKCMITLAVTKDKEHTDFISCVIWNKAAENLVKYQKKGALLGIKGRIQTRTYDRQDGTKAYVTEVVADNVEYLSSKSEMGSNEAQNESKEVPAEVVDIDITADDLPF